MKSNRLAPPPPPRARPVFRWPLVLSILLAAATAGCGNKGDLYLPDEAPPAPAADADD